MGTTGINVGTLGGTSSLGGLGTGIDVQSFVQAALAAPEAQVQQLQTQQTTFGSQTTALQQIQTDLSNLQAAEQALSNPLGELNAQTATSSNSSVLNATADGTATTGVHTIAVNSLATTSSYYSNDVASGDTPIGTGSFTLRVGSNAGVTLTIDSTNNTLNGLAAAINNQDAGVAASVVDDANGARLALVSSTSGAPGDLTISSNTTGLSFTKAVTGSNASLTVDGIPVSSTNDTVSGVIPGVTLNLASPSTSAVSLTVGEDTTSAANAINSFVSACNQAINDINAQFAINPDGSGGGPLATDGSLQDAQAQLLSAVSYAISGNSGVVNLASIGVNLNNDGTLSVDSGTLQAALQNNYASVQNFLQNTSSGFAQNLDNVLNNLNGPATGSLALDLQGLNQTQLDLTSQINDLQASITSQQQVLTQTYSQVNVTLQELPLLTQQIDSQLASA
jgi:flagellar hook-associated protein 2